MITLTINGKKFTARPGTTVLEVCEQQGIPVPTLCSHKELKPYGGCRLCLVEVKGAKNPLAACTLPVQEGMVVATDTDELKKLRRFSLQLILTEHPHACLVCTKTEECARYQECIQKTAVTTGCKFCTRNGNCELQKLVEELEIKEIPFAVSYRNLPVERQDPFFDRDYNLCILCGRCIRACQEVRQASTLDFAGRGPETRVGTAFALDHLDADCQFCGACVDVCPTGALSERFSRWEGAPETSVKTSCPLCSIGCAINLNIKGSKVVSSTPDENQICVRGRFGIAPLINHPKRVTAPLVKKGDRIVEIGWEEAIEYARTKLNEHKGKTGIIFSPQLTGEAIDAVGGFGQSLGATIATARSFEFDPIQVKKLDRDGVYIFVDTDMVSDYSVFLLALRQRGGNPKFIVIDPVKTHSAHKADLWLRPKPGREAALVELLFARNKKADATGVAKTDIEFAKKLIAGKKVYLLGDPNHLTGLGLPKTVEKIPLSSDINALKIKNSGADTTVLDLLGRRDIKCVYSIGAMPKPSRRYETVIIQDLVRPPFDFDLFLPAATFAELNGSFTDGAGRTKRLHKVIEPLGKSKPDEWIIKEIIRHFDGKSGSAHVNKNKPVRAKTVKPKKTTARFPFYLAVRPNAYRYRNRPLSSWLKGFARYRNDTALWINPDDAARLRVKDGGSVALEGGALDCVLPVRITGAVPAGMLFTYENPSLGILNDEAVRVRCIG
jgi:formate dehydrogenase major subunit